MKNYIILTDTRQQKEEHILKEFDKQGILHIRTGLPSADYMAVRYNEEKGFYLDYSILIDTKKDIEEIASNLCNTQEHNRVVREVDLAHELGCTNFIFLILGNFKTTEDIKKWKSKHSRGNGETLLKVMCTFAKHHDCKFMFTTRKNAGAKIVELLTQNNLGNQN